MDVLLLIEALKVIGVTVAENVLYKFLKDYFSSKQAGDVDNFETELQSFLEVIGANVEASTVIEMFASQGLLRIENSILYAPKSISIGAERNAEFIFGHNSVSETDNTKIEAKGNSEIRGTNAEIRQNEDGSISFLVGKKDQKK